MDFSEEWKSLFKISSVFNPPLLLSTPSSRTIVGPLIFNPSPKTLTHLFTSPSLSPISLLTPPPRLSLSRFLVTSAPFIPPSVSSSLSHIFPPEDHIPDASSVFANNRLQLLPCPNNTVLVFFPTGQNSDQVGFVELFLEDSNLVVRGDESCGGDVYVAKNKFNHRIVKILVNPVDDSGVGVSSVKGDLSVPVGYLLVYTMYSVHWFSVRIKGIGSNFEKPILIYLGCKVFKSCGVVDACWSPHLPQESLVLMEGGGLFLFDLDSCLETHSLGEKFKGTRLRVSWNDLGISGNDKWLGCEFSWHPRILIVACSNAVFLVDLRFEECNVSCLAKTEILGTKGSVENDRFLAFTKVDSDGFYFTVASNHRLLLFDVRMPLMPVLQWDHVLDNPCYIDVFRLSELRSHSRDDKYKWASESGFCIILGSFWNCEFSLFCYGPSLPSPKGSVGSQISKFCKSFYAWELPSNLSLSGHKCCCGSCLVREDFLKDALPDWISWQQKEEIVLGFGILSKNLSALLSELDEFGGFALIRLMSSGKLELQRYCASWDSVKKFEETHEESLLLVENNFLYSMDDEEYKFPRRYKYLKLNYLYGYLNGYLAKVLVSNIKKPCTGPTVKESFRADLHKILCENLRAYGIIPSKSSPTVSDVLKDVNFPTSIHEVALRRMWASLPVNILQLGFSSYSEFLEVLVDKKMVSLEFLVVPDKLQLPPFFLRKPSGRSNKWSHKVQRSNDLVGPVLPLPILLTLREVREDGCSHLKEGTLRFDEIVQVAKEMSVSDSGSELQNDHTVSLADDREETWVGSQKSKPFFLYNPVAFSDKCPNGEPTLGNSNYVDERFTTLIAKMPETDPSDKMETVGLELFDDLCPVELKFDSQAMNFGTKELQAYKLLKRQFSKWQEGFKPYQDFCARFKSQKHA
ncbi:hypothetical protein L1049_011047 [Liquidambar formosana]|uniref:Uncharacterized protein n=1 Tax=Liquidambar formosana TaxID=63359 RepID=A0AAP0RR55_LIQFO